MVSSGCRLTATTAKTTTPVRSKILLTWRKYVKNESGKTMCGTERAKCHCHYSHT